MKNDSFDTIINQKLSGHHSPVPADAWDNIVNRKKKRRYAFYWWFFGVLMLTGAGIFGWYIKTNVAGNTLVKKENGNKRKIVIPAHGLNNTNTSAYTIENKKTNNKPEENDLLENDLVKKDLSIMKFDTASSTSDNPNKPGEGQQPNIRSERNKFNQKENSYRFEKKESFGALRKHRSVENIKKGKSVSTEEENKNDGSIEIETEPGIITTKENFNRIETGRHFEFTKWGNLIPADSFFTNKVELLKLQSPVITVNEVNKEKIAKTARKKMNKKLMIDVSVMPTLPVQVNSRLLTIQRTIANSEAKADYTADNIHTSLQPTLAYTIAIRKKIAKKLSIGTGLQYSRIKETVRLSGKEINTKYSVVQRLAYVNAIPVLVDDTIATTTSGIRNIRAMNSYDFISIPLSVHYTLSGNLRWSLSVSGGLYFTIKANYKNSITGNLSPQYASVIKAGDNKNKVNTDIYAGMRLSRTFGKKYKLYAEPEFRYNTGKYILSNMVNYKSIHRAGIAVGFSYELR